MNRLVGLETEYGCLTDDPLGASTAVRRVRDWFFADNAYGLLDQHQRDWDEPAGNGGFLFNGGRAYIDMGHMEVCTAECRSLRDLIARDHAGDRMLCRALLDLKLSGHVGFIRNNVDHYSGATFGCHENYLLRRSAPLHEANVLSLLTFLSLRLLYTGAGRLGCSNQLDLRGGEDPEALAAPFQISQRAEYIQNDLFEWVQFNRAIINTRDEPLADARRFRRLHLIHGDTSVLPWTLAMKVGTTALVLDLLEIDRLPRRVLADAVGSLRWISRHPDGPWTVRLADERDMDAVEILGEYHDLARKEFAGRDDETDLVLKEWRVALEGLSGDVESLVGRCDWVTKRWLFNQFIREENLTWDSGWLKSQDLEFHHTNPAQSLALPLASTPASWALNDEEVLKACLEAPADTRAHVRSLLLRECSRRRRRCFADWELVDADGVNPLTLLDPFDSDEREARQWLSSLDASALRKGGRGEGDMSGLASR